MPAGGMQEFEVDVAEKYERLLISLPPSAVVRDGRGHFWKKDSMRSQLWSSVHGNKRLAFSCVLADWAPIEVVQR